MGEADSKGFCDSMEHDGRSRLVAERSDERALLGVIRKGRQAGILDTRGAILPAVTGTPPGGVVSPVLSTG